MYGVMRDKEYISMERWLEKQETKKEMIILKT